MARVDPSETIELSLEELSCLRLALELFGDQQCPFGDVPDLGAARLEEATRALIGRGLVEKRRFRPDRDLARRLLVVSEPDARTVLLTASAASAQPRLEIFERTNASVAYTKEAERHRFGPVLEPREAFDDVAARFTPRRSMGDFIDLELGPAERFAFMSFARELARDADLPAVLTGEIPVSPLESTLAGSVLTATANPHTPDEAPGRLPKPSQREWDEALHSLKAKDVVRVQQDGYHLKGFLRDLAVALAHQTRHVLTRFEYSEEGPTVRDIVFVPVQGSLFSLGQTVSGGLRVRELDERALDEALRDVLGPNP